MSRMITLQKKSRGSSRRGAKRATVTIPVVAVDARDSAVRYAEATREWAAPKVEPAVDKVRTDVLPAVAGAVATALAATEPVRAEAATRGSAALAALRGEVAPPRRRSRHRIRKLFVLATVLGAAYAGWKAWAARSSDPVDAWTTPVTPVKPPVGNVTPVGAPLSDDPAGASPDEALADANAGDVGSVDLTTTEPVTTARSKKVSDAAAKGSTGSGSDTV